MKKIVQQDDKILRKIATPVAASGITKAETRTMITEMFEALATQHDGVALAAPQIGYSKRAFVISDHIFDTGIIPPLVYINPIITKKSRDKKQMEEGCLSCRWWYGKVKRSTRITVSATDENGQPFTYEGKGLLAQIFQHEIDHLDGILFLDTAKDLREIDPE
jgi:peptide deformylase